jgi:hypothetical protein
MMTTRTFHVVEEPRLLALVAELFFFSLPDFFLHSLALFLHFLLPEPAFKKNRLQESLFLGSLIP